MRSGNEYVDAPVYGVLRKKTKPKRRGTRGKVRCFLCSKRGHKKDECDLFKKKIVESGDWFPDPEEQKNYIKDQDEEEDDGVRSYCSEEDSNAYLVNDFRFSSRVWQPRQSLSPVVDFSNTYQHFDGKLEQSNGIEKENGEGEGREEVASEEDTTNESWTQVDEGW
jgi:hypothetical protein